MTLLGTLAGEHFPSVRKVLNLEIKSQRGDDIDWLGGSVPGVGGCLYQLPKSEWKPIHDSLL